MKPGLQDADGAGGCRRESRRDLIRGVGLMAAVLAAALAVAACGSGTSTKALTTLTIADPIYPPTLDPAQADNANGDFINLAYDPLIIRAPDNTFKPGLAVGWKYGPRNESFTIHLRPNVKFSDGTPLDAEAVKAWLKHAVTFPNSEGYLSYLSSIDVTGPLSLTLKFSQPTPGLPLVFSQFVEVGMIGSPKAVKAKTLASSTDGAGPYVLDKANTVPRDHYTYIPNPYYWNKKAIYWKKIVVKVIANPSTAYQALVTGQVQLVEAEPVQYIASARAAGLKFVAPPSLLMGLALMDRGGKALKPLSDVRVRQALNYAVDRQADTRVLGAGYGIATEQMAVHGDAEGYDPALNNTYPYDPAKAKQLLAEAGYPHGFTLPVVSIGLVGQDTLAQLLTSQYAKIGVTLKPDITATLADYVTGIGSGKFPAATMSWGRIPAVTNYQLLWGPTGGYNPFKSNDPRLNALYARLAAAPAAGVGPLAREMQAFLVEQAWFVPVTANPLVVLFSSKITGVNASDLRDNAYTNEFRPAN